MNNSSAQERAAWIEAPEVIPVSGDTSEQDNNIPAGTETTPRTGSGSRAHHDRDGHTGTPRGLSPSIFNDAGLSPSDELCEPPTRRTCPSKTPCPCPQTLLGHRIGCLHDAARQRSPDPVRRLLLAGAPARIQDNDGNTPLHVALVSTPLSVETVSLLVFSGTTNIANMNGFTPFHLLLKQASELQDAYTGEVHRFLALGADPQLQFPSRESPLGCFLNGCMLLGLPPDDTMFVVIQRLLSEDHILDTALSYRENVLEWLLELDEPSIADYAFDMAKALCEVVDIAQCNGRPDILDLADPSKKFYPLHQAVRNLGEASKFKECIDILLARGADPNRLDHRRLSPLQVLLQLEGENVPRLWATETLLKYGAEPMQGDGSPHWTILFASREIQFANGRLVVKSLLGASFQRIANNRVLPTAHYSWHSFWIYACRSINNWTLMMDQLELASHNFPGNFPSEARAALAQATREVLAAKYVERMTIGVEESDELDIKDISARRDSFVIVLQNCRLLGIPIQPKWYEYLLSLCVRILDFGDNSMEEESDTKSDSGYGNVR